MRKEFHILRSVFIAISTFYLSGCIAQPKSANPDLQRSVSIALSAAPGQVAHDPAILQMDYYIFDGKKRNKLSGEASLYHVALITDSKTDMKSSQQHPDVFVTAGGQNKAYSSSIVMTGTSRVRLLVGLYDENGIGNNRKERLKTLTDDLSVFPPINAWTVAGVQALKVIAIVPAFWDLLFPDQPVVPRSEFFIERQELNGKAIWSIPETEISSDQGKIVLTLKSVPGAGGP